MAHLAGHGTRSGFLWWPSSSAGEVETIPKARFVEALESQRRSASRTLECVFLDGCQMQDIARDLHAAGLPYVIYWHGRVEDELSIAFSKNFYDTLKGMPGQWGSVARHSWLATEMEHGSGRLEGTLCMLWNDPGHPGPALDPEWTVRHGEQSTQPIRWQLSTATSEALRLAVVIGNSDYITAKKLTNPRHDAEKVSSRLRELGFHVLGRGESGFAWQETPTVAPILDATAADIDAIVETLKDALETGEQLTETRQLIVFW